MVETLNHYKMVKKKRTLCTKRWWGHKNFLIISSSLALVLALETELVVALEIELELALETEIELAL